ncbi:MAG: BatD family protein [Opitutaceae bacterium]
MRLFRLLLSAFALIAAAAAQTARWEQSEGGLGTNLALVFENCEPDGQPALPSIPGLAFAFSGRSESVNIVNFQMTRSVTLGYAVRTQGNQPLRIPAFMVRTNKGDVRVEAFDAARPAVAIDSLASSRLAPERRSVWAGEVFGLNYELSAARRTNPQISPTFDWNPAPLVAEDWSKPEVTERNAGGERRVNVVFRTRAVARVPNTLKLEAATHLISVQTGTIGFGIISQPRMEQVSVTSDQPTLEVKPLPAGAPASFGGAVGQFKLTSKVVPEKAAVGEPVTWTLELTGTGNWPDIAGLPPRNVSQDFKVVQPKARRTPAEGKLFDATLTEDVVLVPSKPGTYTLGPVTLAYFDPQSGTYRTVTTPKTSLVITAPAAPQFNVMPAPSAGAGESAQSAPADAAPPKPVVAAAAPGGIPRDPLPSAPPARAPFTTRELALALATPFALTLFLWLWLALRRARETDPARPQREARARLAATLRDVDLAPADRKAALLVAWQRDTAILWGVTKAAPSADAIDSTEWTTLWREADRAIYGKQGGLPADWVSRAQEALARKKPVPFRFHRLFLPRNLMPFAASLALILGATLTLRAASAHPGVSYRKGDFAAAESTWRESLRKTPLDWSTRHNLSLALEQQDRAGEAAAHAAVAFVQNPAQPAVRWHFTRTAEKLGAAASSLAGFINPGFIRTLAREASPADWQLRLVGAAWLLAAALVILLLRAYRGAHGAWKWIAGTVGVSALALSALSVNGILAYGTAAHPESAIVARATTLRSIPTEADTAQKTTPLAAGGLALIDRSFLCGHRLAFEGGQTGWVRKEDVVPLWK